MEKLENKTEEVTEVIDGAGILPNGTYLMSKEEVEQMALRNVRIIPYQGMTIVENARNKTIIPEGNYLTTPEEVEQIARNKINKIKYQ